MTLLAQIFLFIVLVMLSNLLNHYINAVPLALIQIALGLLTALLFDFELLIPSDLFLLFFVAPLLFHAGRRFPVKQIKILTWPTIAFSTLLVFVTAFFGGAAIQAFIPALPLAGGIALMSILAPIDHIMVDENIKLVPLPQKILRLVEGEALVNEVSGLTAFKFAILAITTGHFSMREASANFFYSLVAGFIIGYFLINVINIFESWVIEEGINDTIFMTLIQLVTPFFIYYVAEHLLHASGGIAVVTAGVLSQNTPLKIGNLIPDLLITREHVWHLAVYLLTGVIFIILGMEFVIAFQHVSSPTASFLVTVAFCIILAYLILSLIRFLWTWGYIKLEQRKPYTYDQPWLTALTATLIGSRGAINMASVLSIPLLVDTGQPFPHRDFIIIVSAGVIGLSIIVPPLFVPFLSKRLAGSNTTWVTASHQRGLSLETLEEYEARKMIVSRAIDYLEKVNEKEDQLAILDLLTEYQILSRKIDREIMLLQTENSNGFEDEEEEAVNFALNSEVRYLNQLLIEKEIDQTLYRFFKSNIVRKKQQFKTKKMTFITRLKQMIILQFKLDQLAKLFIKKQSDFINEEKIYQVELDCSLKAIEDIEKEIRAQKDKKNHYVVTLDYLIKEYQNNIERIYLYGADKMEDYLFELYELHVQTLTAERAFIQQLYEEGRISRTLAAKLRQFVNYSEISMMAIIHSDESF
ncbi:cation:proton antiporter [Vagococcus elongatus]|uniref:Cation/H+ exchanger transmembrane domain-containing protein n=1 Tax=Vagococcus elongatus TaxID=180344 RepID=A0A430B269_9ENTE|nr:sodium:proton antiporter [Vagococcus elongatus]RSU14322.1 hypothetical protein CBF29_03200 [Vagococcus elongatus]